VGGAKSRQQVSFITPTKIENRNPKIEEKAENHVLG
jgi:hypothetical protein